MKFSAKTVTQTLSAKQIIGRRVRQERVLLGLSQSMFALQIGLYRSYVGRVERGIQNVSADTMDQFAQFFQISASDLLDTHKLDTSQIFEIKKGRKPLKS